LPVLGPLVRATLLYDFASPDLDASEIDWDAELQVLGDQRLAAVAERMLRDLRIQPPEHVRRDLQDEVFAWSQTSCLASGRATADLQVLGEAGIGFVVIKGPGIASLARRLPERPYSDVDILVAAEQFGHVQRLLARSGYLEETKNLVPRPSLGDLCREAVNLRNPDGGSIDVHHRVPPWLWGSHLTFADVLFRSTVQPVPGGGSLPCASPADNLLVSALHVVSAKNRPGETLMAWRDVLVCARASDPADVLDRAERSRLTGYLAWVLGALPTETLPHGLLEGLGGGDPGVPHAGRLRMVIPPGIASRRMVLSQMCRLPAWNAARYAAGIAWPSSGFLEAKMGGIAHPRIRWLRSLAGGEDNRSV
jgi:hypothetical protein